MEEFKQGFIEEALQLCEKLEEKLLSIEGTEIIDGDIQEIFRILHTIKGSSAMFGFSNTEKISHELENIYDLIRDEKLNLNQSILGLTITTNDLIITLLNNNDELSEGISEKYDKAGQGIKEILGNYKKDYTPSEIADSAEMGIFEENESPTSVTKYYYIYFKPDNDILQRGISPVDVFDELSEFGQITGFPYTDEVPSPEQYDPASFFLGWDIFIKTDQDNEDIADCFMFYLDHEYKLIEIDPLKITENKGFLDTCIQLNKGNLSLEVINRKLSTLISKEEAIPIEQPKKRTSETELQLPITEGGKNIEAIKVDSKKLDELINLVSELVTLNSQLEIQTAAIDNDDIKSTIKSVSKLSKRFRDNALELRLIPVKVLILKLQRLVRDVSKSLNKEIEFITQGTETELDKNIISKLEGPLLHILRNSIDHGIEPPEERKKAGKPENGIIRFIAFYSGSNVFIQIQDDGRGIDVNKVKAKAEEKGLLDKKGELSRAEIFNLLFTPGFSTSDKVSNVSGRGVGLDVVKKEITDMRGEIDIESEKGLGTSFTLKLPLTLSIIDTLRVQVHNTHILIPREFIIQTGIYYNKSCKYIDKIEFEKQILPVISLRNDFNAQLEPLTKQYNVIVKQYDKLFAIQVDKIIGEHQAVVKPLGYYNRDHDFFSGASILGDGSLAFILDVNKLINTKKNKSKIGNYNLK